MTIVVEFPTGSPSPGQSVSGPTPSSGPATPGRSGGSVVVLIVLVAIGVLATMWIRRAAARYRRRLDR
jgi:hypothetical protein